MKKEINNETPPHTHTQTHIKKTTTKNKPKQANYMDSNL